MSPITCQSCNHENEPTRVFCHKCGVRLPRDVVAEQAIQKKNTEVNRKAAATRKTKPISKKAAWNWSDVISGTISSFLHLLILSALGAAVILTFRKPADTPNPVQGDPQLVKAGDQQLLDAVENTRPKTISATQSQINTYLAEKLQLRGKPMGILGEAEVQNVFVILEKNTFRLGVSYTMAGLPLVIQGRFAMLPPNQERGSYSLKLDQSSLGRLMLPPRIFEKMMRWYDPIAYALEEPLNQLSQADSIQIEPDLVSVSWNSKASTSPQDSALPPSSFSSPSLQAP